MQALDEAARAALRVAHCTDEAELEQQCKRATESVQRSSPSMRTAVLNLMHSVRDYSIHSGDFGAAEMTAPSDTHDEAAEMEGSLHVVGANAAVRALDLHVQLASEAAEISRLSVGARSVVDPGGHLIKHNDVIARSPYRRVLAAAQVRIAGSEVGRLKQRRPHM